MFCYLSIKQSHETARVRYSVFPHIHLLLAHLISNKLNRQAERERAAFPWSTFYRDTAAKLFLQFALRSVTAPSASIHWWRSMGRQAKRPCPPIVFSRGWTRSFAICDPANGIESFLAIAASDLPKIMKKERNSYCRIAPYC